MTAAVFNPPGKQLVVGDLPAFELVANLLWYDGPLLDAVKDTVSGEVVLAMWLDCTETYNLWGYLWLTPAHQAMLLAGDAPLYEMVEEATRVVVFRTEDTAAWLDIREIDRAVLLAECAPSPGARLTIDEEGQAALRAAFPGAIA